jgi:hypothetical protein
LDQKYVGVICLVRNKYLLKMKTWKGKILRFCGILAESIISKSWLLCSQIC